MGYIKAGVVVAGFFFPIITGIALHAVDGDWHDADVAEANFFKHMWDLGTAICAAFITAGVTRMVYALILATCRGLLIKYLQTWFGTVDGSFKPLKMMLLLTTPIIAWACDYTSDIDTSGMHGLRDFLEMMCTATVYVEVLSVTCDIIEATYEGALYEYGKSFAHINSTIGHGIAETISMEEAEELFKSSDANSDGVVTRQELDKRLSDFGIDQKRSRELFDELDVDGNGVINKEEFMEGCRRGDLDADMEKLEMIRWRIFVSKLVVSIVAAGIPFIVFFGERVGGWEKDKPYWRTMEFFCRMTICMLILAFIHDSIFAMKAEGWTGLRRYWETVGDAPFSLLPTETMDGTTAPQVDIDSVVREHRAHTQVNLDDNGAPGEAIEMSEFNPLQSETVSTSTDVPAQRVDGSDPQRTPHGDFVEVDASMMIDAMPLTVDHGPSSLQSGLSAGTVEREVLAVGYDQDAKYATSQAPNHAPQHDVEVVEEVEEVEELETRGQPLAGVVPTSVLQDRV